MTKTKTIKSIKEYLKQHFIKFLEDHDGETERITMVFTGYDNCPDNAVEACIYFFGDSMECRVYYSETGAECCKQSANRLDLIRVLNFINARVWPLTANDGVEGLLYSSSHLFAPRFYITEDDYFDITATTLIPYDFYEVAILETNDFITVSLPTLLDELSNPIFSCLNGNISSEQAIAYIKKEILSE